MRLTSILLFAIITTVQGQDYRTAINYSPDKNFGLLVTTSELPDANTGWKYWVISNKGDTTLLTSTITHDEFAPVTFWSRSSEELIFEDQKWENDSTKIKIYNLHDKKIVFETHGFIWGNGTNNFDQERGLVFYFKRIGNKNEIFELTVLNIDTKEIEQLDTVTTSGDSYTGSPEIATMDQTKRKITISFETKDYEQVKKVIAY